MPHPNINEAGSGSITPTLASIRQASIPKKIAIMNPINFFMRNNEKRTSITATIIPTPALTNKDPTRSVVGVPVPIISLTNPRIVSQKNNPPRKPRREKRMCNGLNVIFPILLISPNMK